MARDEAWGYLCDTREEAVESAEAVLDDMAHQCGHVLTSSPRVDEVQHEGAKIRVAVSARSRRAVFGK
jgi:hypothetical protein